MNIFMKGIFGANIFVENIFVLELKYCWSPNDSSSPSTQGYKYVKTKPSLGGSLAVVYYLGFKCLGVHRVHFVSLSCITLMHANDSILLSCMLPSPKLWTKEFGLFEALEAFR
jgi:hypothetical protein